MNLTKMNFKNSSVKFSKKLILSRLKASLVQESIKRKILSDAFKKYRTKFITASLTNTRDKIKFEANKLFDSLKKKLLSRNY